jgi:hypothetical protein
MTTGTRLIRVVAVLLAGGSVTADFARAGDNCLAAPNMQPPQGSHWYYHTEPVNHSKCWYLRTEDQAVQKPTAQEKPEIDVSARQPAAVSSKSASYQPKLEPLDLGPIQRPSAASGNRLATGNIQHRARASREAGAEKVGQPGPPPPAGAANVPWPDPPSPVSAGNVPWPDPPSPASARNVPWTDPAPPVEAGKVAWPDPPSPAGGIAHGATTENPPEERVNQTHEVPAAAPHSDKDAGDEPGVGGQVAMPDEKAISQSEMPVAMLSALAIVLMIAGLLLRRIISLTFARRRTADLDRGDAVRTSTAIESAMPKFLVRHDLAPNSVNNDHLDDEVKEALRKLLRVLDEQAV